MRVLIDRNVFLSYILAPSEPRSVTTVITACLTANQIDLLIPPEQINELADSVANKRYFRTHIPRALIDDLLAQLVALGEMHPALDEFASFSRDPKDDYLVAYGIVNEADYLITGDRDLLVLDRVGELQVVTPAEFLQILPGQLLLP